MAAVPRLTEKEAFRRGAETNPYVGPRAFREQDRLYGREQELAELVDLVVAERVVLMYSPSGAGKTSLIQASLIPELRRQRFRPLPPARVNLPKQADTEINQYEMSVMLSLESQLRLPHTQQSAEQLSTIHLPEYLRAEANRKPPLAEGVPLVLIIDQFEEILLLDPGDQSGQSAFFRQLGDALDKQRLWVLLSMREEYLGGLDKFSYELPTSLNVRYRLDLLTRPAAKSAIQSPPEKDHDVTVCDAAVDLLVKNLSTIIVQRPGNSASREESPYVEGVLLQTVCRQIWDEIDPLRNGIKTIKPEDLGDLQNVDRALAKYYSDAVARAARSAKLSQRLIRDWFEDVLITQHGFRSQTESGPGE
ncbi:MAG TPA: ATP-binding protein, partial [Gemmatimonadales bacterium]|nr:ATP-binding protein [Gemmatimonadales bacterium]